MNHKKLKALIILITIVALTFGALSYFSFEQRLHRLGYSSDEAKSFVTLLDQAAIKDLLSREPNANYAALLALEDFQADNFTKYLDSLARNDLNLSQTIALVNHPDYEDGRIYSASMLNIMLEENYLSGRRERYFILSEQSNRESADSHTIVSLVNANRDYEFYTETAPANLDDNYLMLVNKYYYLDENFTPDLVTIDAKHGAVGIQIEREAYDAFTRMANAALTDGIQLYITSGYRDYAGQVEVYSMWVQSVGEEQAPNYAALPGYSEHQTGLALDIFTLGETTNTFASCATAKWLAEHAPEFGFILRYTEGFENLTGYDYEAWHFRYVGTEASTIIARQGITFEEYWAIQHEK